MKKPPLKQKYSSDPDALADHPNIRFWLVAEPPYWPYADWLKTLGLLQTADLFFVIGHRPVLVE